ncbi:MAG: hypothetical protein Q9203_007024 [Teloschistes exilis]
MWTRVLCWDRKWLYVVTHFVERGAVRPRGFAFQPWKNKTDRAKEATSIAEDKEKERGKEGKSSAKKPLFFAIAVAKYVCKRGRLTIPPELVLRNSGLLPPKPQEQPTPATPQPEEKTADSPSLAPQGEKDATTALPPIADLATAPTPTAGDAATQAGAGEEWTWHRIETERQRGMAIMEAWNRTEALDEAFGGSEAVALGEFWDFP